MLKGNDADKPKALGVLEQKKHRRFACDMCLRVDVESSGTFGLRQWKKGCQMTIRDSIKSTLMPPALAVGFLLALETAGLAGSQSMRTSAYSGTPCDSVPMAEWESASAQAQRWAANVTLDQVRQIQGGEWETVESFKADLEHGEAEAYHGLGDIYEHGVGVPLNIQVARSLYEQAACMGNYSRASYRLGRIFSEGRGVERDVSMAIGWHKLAARQGNPYSPFLLGQMYEKGEGVNRDEKEAFNWYKTAVERENIFAYFPLGLMYERGIYANGENVVQQDIEQAKKLYEAAALRRNRSLYEEITLWNSQ